MGKLLELLEKLVRAIFGPVTRQRPPLTPLLPPRSR